MQLYGATVRRSESEDCAMEYNVLVPNVIEQLRTIERGVAQQLLVLCLKK